MAISAFLLFKNINFSSRIINSISSGVFATYLLQDFLIKKVFVIEYIIY